MAENFQKMRLTPELVARVNRHIEDPGEQAYPDAVWCSDRDRNEAIAKIMDEKPATADVWIFAYGSLIWKPAFEYVEYRTGVVRGWHRSFCLGWIKRFRGSAEHPGLMLALDHGGECAGVAYRLAPDRIQENLAKLFQREMLTKPDAMLPIWINIETGLGTIPAITFVIDPEGQAYVGGLSIERTADALATAVGHVGSMANYLYRTVKKLEDLGLDDAYLWQLQELVAERIEAALLRLPLCFYNRK